MKNKDIYIKFLSLIIFFIVAMSINVITVNATGITSSTAGGTSTTTCTHTVYSTGSPSTYHYTYCDVCGKCKSRTKHSVSSTSNYRKWYISYCILFLWKKFG